MFDDDMKSKIETLFQVCHSHGWTFGLAESCTGGLVSSQITMLPGVSAVFKGAIVCYAGHVKRDVLGVPSSALKYYGEVSLPVAR